RSAQQAVRPRDAVVACDQVKTSGDGRSANPQHSAVTVFLAEVRMSPARPASSLLPPLRGCAERSAIGPPRPCRVPVPGRTEPNRAEPLLPLQEGRGNAPLPVVPILQLGPRGPDGGELGEAAVRRRALAVAGRQVTRDPDRNWLPAPVLRPRRAALL